jgi:UDP-glucose 4-epimerase
LIPLLIKAAHTNTEFSIYGTDYSTPDGTSIRDYIHVEDLCTAHLAALEYLDNAIKPCIYNLGSGKGWSVKEVITTVEQVLGKSIKIKEVARRPGDPAILVANPERAMKQLNWSPRYGLADMIKHACARLGNNLQLVNS